VTDYHGLPTRTLSNAYLRLDYLAEAGPRLVRLVVAGSARQENMLAETPGISWPTPYGDYFLRGGHRLWHAPEGTPRSSIPDTSGLQVEDLPGGVRLSQPTETATGIAKAMEIRLCPDRPALTLTHSLQNNNLWAVEIAPWAITQLVLGGVALLPQTPGPVDLTGLHPNRHFALWPYTSMNDPRLEFYDDVCLVHGRPRLPAFKMGYENRQGWVAYGRDDVVLVKRFCPEPARPHPDYGCNVEVYVNDTHLELELLGPLCRLEPGQAARHVERWEFHTGLTVTPEVEAVREVIQTLAPHLAPLSRLEIESISPGTTL
jgi:hypothetical protein